MYEYIYIYIYLYDYIYVCLVLLSFMIFLMKRRPFFVGFEHVLLDESLMKAVVTRNQL